MFPVFLEYQLSLHKSPVPVQVAGKLHEACTVIPLASSNKKAVETAAAAKRQKKKKARPKMLSTCFQQNGQFSSKVLISTKWWENAKLFSCWTEV